jgi:hypothetical protein
METTGDRPKYLTLPASWVLALGTALFPLYLVPPDSALDQLDHGGLIVFFTSSDGSLEIWLEMNLWKATHPAPRTGLGVGEMGDSCVLICSEWAIGPVNSSARNRF